MIYGTVKVWKADRGFGFVAPDDGGQDVFAHVSALVGVDALEPGQRVSFEVATGDRGVRAINVEIVT